MTERGGRGRTSGASARRRSSSRAARGKSAKPATSGTSAPADKPTATQSVTTKSAGVPKAGGRVRPTRRPAPRRPLGRFLAGRGLFGVTTTRRAAVLAIVVCALALSVAVPLRTYLSQRADVEVQEQKQAELRARVQQLEERKAQLSDPAQVQAEARSRLRYVMPGETPYMVQLPGDQGTQPGAQPTAPNTAQQPWFQELWNSITGTGR